MLAGWALGRVIPGSFLRALSVAIVDPSAAVIFGEPVGRFWSPSAGFVYFRRVLMALPGVEYGLEESPTGQNLGAGSKQ
jgi:hypothetical protein